MKIKRGGMNNVWTNFNFKNEPARRYEWICKNFHTLRILYWPLARWVHFRRSNRRRLGNDCQRQWNFCRLRSHFWLYLFKMSLIKIYRAAISRPMIFYSLFTNCLQKTLEMFIIARAERSLNLRPQPFQRSKVLKCQVFFANSLWTICKHFPKILWSILQVSCR